MDSNKYDHECNSTYITELLTIMNGSYVYFQNLLIFFYFSFLYIIELQLLFLNFRGIAHKTKCIGILRPYFLSRFSRSKSQGYIDLVKPFGPSGCLHPGRQNNHWLIWTTGIDMPYFSHTRMEKCTNSLMQNEADCWQV